MRTLLSNAHIRALIANLFACALLLLPDFYVRHLAGEGFLPDAITLLTGALLFILAGAYPALFRIVAIPFLVVNVLYLHVAKTWGPLLTERIEVAMEAPFYEAFEYLVGYFGPREAKLLAYLGVSVIAVFLTRPIGVPRPAALPALFLCLGACILAFDRNSDVLHTHPYSSMIVSYEDARVRHERMETRKAALEQIGPRKLNCTERYRNILIVMGESANRTRMSLYGYPKPTTPFFQSLTPFRFDAIAPTNQTRLSLPIMLTDASVDNYEAFFSLPSIVSDVRACGYETYWISNQGRTGPNDSANGSIGREADYYWPRDMTLGSQPDSVLIPRIKQALGSSAARKAVFVHLIGSHLVYRRRYPEDFPVSAVKTIVDEYDESIRYTDFILAQVYELFPRDDLLFIYTADHGELVRYSDAGDYQGHGYSPSYKAEYQIPLVIWSSRPERVRRLHEMAHAQQINADSFAEIARYLMGITHSPRLSFSTKVLEVSETAIVDFEKLRD
jgi:heptose-I-phosphate ethanolaminephosphotransferase